MSVNQKLAYLRKKNGLSQLKLAETLHVSRQDISRWETGAAMPSTDNLRSLSELYSVLLQKQRKNFTSSVRLSKCIMKMKIVQQLNPIT